MATLNYWFYAEIPDGSNIIPVGSLSTPVQFTFSAGEFGHKKLTALAAATSAVLFTVGAGEDITALDGFIVKATKGSSLSIEGAAAANNSTIPLAANQWTFISGSQIWVYGAAGDFAGAAQTNIVTVRVRNNEVALTADVEAWFFN